MIGTWVYHKDRKQQHQVSCWGYWGVNTFCGMGVSHTVLAACEEGQDECPICAKNHDCYARPDTLPRDAKAPYRGIPDEVGHIPAGECVVPNEDLEDDDEWG